MSTLSVCLFLCLHMCIYILQTSIYLPLEGRQGTSSMSKQELLSYRSFISLVRQFYTFICKTSHKKFDFFIIHDSIYTKPIEEKALFMER